MTNNTSWWLSETLPGVLKNRILPNIMVYFLVHLDTLEESLWNILILRVYPLEEINLVKFPFSWNIYIYEFININIFLDPLIIWLNEIILKSNHALFHRVGTLHHGIYDIFHILCCPVFQIGWCFQDYVVSVEYFTLACISLRRN